MTYRSNIIVQARIPDDVEIADAAIDLVGFAAGNKCFVEATFQGCPLMAGPNDDPADLVTIFLKHQNEKRSPWLRRDGFAWKEPTFPGDAVLEARMTKGDEIGFINIAFYGDGSFRSASFLPGRQVCTLGDTPKTEPEVVTWSKTKEDADVAFARQLRAAVDDGWKQAGDMGVDAFDPRPHT